MSFVVSSPYHPAGDQPAAIAALSGGVRTGTKFQVLNGRTGSGKTRVMAEVSAETGRSALVISPTKVLAHQTYTYLKRLFPHNAVKLFVSDYIRFNPEARKVGHDSYIEKHAVLDPRITEQRREAVISLLTRPDVIVVASVSAVFGIGSPESLRASMFTLHVGQKMRLTQLLAQLDDNAYRRSDRPLAQGTFRVCGLRLEIRPPTVPLAYRVELANGRIGRLSLINPDNGEAVGQEDKVTIYPASVVIMPKETVRRYTPDIRRELSGRVRHLKSQGKYLQAERLNDRTLYDIELMEDRGYCPGVENYNRPLQGLPPGATPNTLVNFFPEDAILFMDESHLMVPQIKAMFNRERKGKKELVDHGYRLPSALDHRPLSLDEVEKRFNSVIYVSATPRPYELAKTDGKTVDMVIRPTYLLDPIIKLKLSGDFFPHLLRQIRKRVAVGEQVLVMVTKIKRADEVAGQLSKEGIRCKAVHSGLKQNEREKLLDDLREGRLDVLVGIGLLREGLDLPRVSLVAILDADKGGLNRSETDLLQMIGRVTRNVNGLAILYRDTENKAMRSAITKTRRHRKIQEEYNEANGIKPGRTAKAV